MICIYHNKDLDGICSGAIVKERYPNAKMIGYDYGEPFDLNSLPVGEPVIMVDVSMPTEMMFAIAERSGFEFTWIDHHKSALQEWDEFFLRMNPLAEGDKKVQVQDEFGVRVYRSGNTIIMERFGLVGTAACELVWQYFYSDISQPWVVYYLGLYDTWREIWDRRME